MDSVDSEPLTIAGIVAQFEQQLKLFAEQNEIGEEDAMQLASMFVLLNSEKSAID